MYRGLSQQQPVMQMIPPIPGPVVPGGPIPKEYSTYYDLFIEVFMKNDQQISSGDPRDMVENDEKLR
jgi:hypothetical protein